MSTSSPDEIPGVRSQAPTRRIHRILKSRTTALLTGAVIGGTSIAVATNNDAPGHQSESSSQIDVGRPAPTPALPQIDFTQAQKDFPFDREGSSYVVTVAAQALGDGRLNISGNLSNADPIGELVRRGNPEGPALYSRSIELRCENGDELETQFGTLLDRRSPGSSLGTTRTAGAVGGNDIGAGLGECEVHFKVGDLDDLSAEPTNFVLPLTLQPSTPSRTQPSVHRSGPSSIGIGI